MQHSNSHMDTQQKIETKSVPTQASKPCLTARLLLPTATSWSRLSDSRLSDYIETRTTRRRVAVAKTSHVSPFLPLFLGQHVSRSDIVSCPRHLHDAAQAPQNAPRPLDRIVAPPSPHPQPPDAADRPGMVAQKGARSCRFFTLLIFPNCEQHIFFLFLNH